MPSIKVECLGPESVYRGNFAVKELLGWYGQGWTIYSLEAFVVLWLALNMYRNLDRSDYTSAKEIRRSIHLITKERDGNPLSPENDPFVVLQACLIVEKAI